MGWRLFNMRHNVKGFDKLRQSSALKMAYFTESS